MEKALIIIFIGAIVFMAHAFVIMFEKTKVPDILYLIIIGLLVGPVLKLARPEDFGKVGHIFTTIALVVILFEGGLDLQFELLKQTIKGTLFLAITSYVVTFLLLGSLFYFAGWYDMITAAFLGSVLAGPAPAVVIPLAKHLKIKERTKTTLMLEAGLGEALCILVSLAIFESMKAKEIQTAKALGGIFSSFFVAVVIGLLGGYFWSIMLNKIRTLGNTLFTTPSFVFIIYGLCDFLGFSGPICVLAFGATLGNISMIKVPLLSKKLDLVPIEHNNMEKKFFSEIVFLLKTFFFVYLGLSIQFKNVLMILTAAAVVAILFITRIISIKIAVSKKATHNWDASIMSIMISKGLATAVLGSLFIENHLPGGANIKSTIYYTIVLSVIATSLLIFLMEKTKMKGIFYKVFSNYLSEENNSA